VRCEKGLREEKKRGEKRSDSHTIISRRINPSGFTTGHKCHPTRDEVAQDSECSVDGISMHFGDDQGRREII
jgi:hypothetical protein